MSKSRDAFRTISEVSDWLDTPAHVLRFWESKFSQIKPVKRAGGRRYYRPQDMELLSGIKKLLHEDGMTIKGAQKLLREKGIKHVAALGRSFAESASARSEEPQERVPAPSIKTIEAAPARSEPEAGPEPAPEDAAPEAEVAITNVVQMTPDRSAPKGPALSVNLSTKPDADAAKDTDTEADEPPVDATSGTDLAALAAAVPADPGDAASRAQARIFHLLRDLPGDHGLRSKADRIAPLLSRLEDLRSRTGTR